MKGGGRRTRPPAEHSTSKRRHSPAQQRCHLRYSKKRRLVSETETLTATSQIVHTPWGTNYSETTHSSSQNHKKYKKHLRRKSSESDGHRKWVYSSSDLSGTRDRVVFLSYNVLGVENASKHPDLYFDVAPKYLDWDRRKKLLCKEISQYSASILCFQEVDRFLDLDNLLQTDGFRGVYQAPTGEACDGCAIFWEHDLFTLLHHENIVFQKFGLRDNVAQFCVLKMNQNQSSSSLNVQTSQAPSSRSLLVGNIHVLFNPNRGDMKLGQVRMFLEKAHELSQEWGNIPVVLAGDFNSMPQSAMYEFLASSELNLHLHDRRKMSGQISQFESQAFQSRNNYAASFRSSVSRSLSYRWSDEELTLATGTRGLSHLRHSLKLCSAYSGIKSAQGNYRTRDRYGEPLATSYHSKFMGTVDYIWHTPTLVPVRVLDTLPVEILRRTRGLPSKNWGSDHLALVCELAFTDNGEGT